MKWKRTLIAGAELLAPTSVTQAKGKQEAKNVILFIVFHVMNQAARLEQKATEATN